MRNFHVTVDGKTYEVAVEEIKGGKNAGQSQAPTPEKSVEKTPEAPAAPAAGGGKLKVEAPMQGKVFNIPVTQGQSVKKGDVVLVLEAMKMENDVVAPEDGTIASVEVTVSQSVQAGDILVTMN